jgi:hypothetical protein
MKVLTDLHHGVLYEALAMLFEDRFGADLHVWQDGHYVTEPKHHADFPPRKVRVLSTDGVRVWRPDIVVSTAPATRRPMQDLAREVGARYIDHIGNAWDAPVGDDVLWSVPHDGPIYHPEFHRVPWTPPAGNRIGAFHASFAHLPCYVDWLLAAERFPEYEFVHAGTPETMLYPWQVADAMADCVAIWHCKDADGYGFTVHEAFASGRAIIGHAEHYAGKLAEPLFRAGHVEPRAIDVALYDPVLFGRAARASFEEIVNFDAEAEMIRETLAVAA